MLEIRQATENEYFSIRSFYHNMIDMMKDSEYKPCQEKEIYPSDEYLRDSLVNNELWVCKFEKEIAAAMVVNHKNNDGYKNVKWLVEAEQNDVLIVHALGVMPTYQGKGIAGTMVKKVIDLAEKTNQRAIRLDVLGGNIPAEKLYIKHGFKYIDTVKMFYEDTGWTDFKLFEYLI